MRWRGIALNGIFFRVMAPVCKVEQYLDEQSKQKH